MICKVKNTIEKHCLIKKGSSVAVGVSGGADSMCLLDILSSLKEEYGIILKAVHLNHNLRGEEAVRDETLVRNFCRSRDIELLVFSEDIRRRAEDMGMGEEECGRVIRYRCFRDAQCDFVATAHTLSDSIETAVFNLVRGTGSKGLCGIPAKREPNIVRPLIDCTRAEIEEYCRLNSVPFVTDSTNLSDDYTRNFIRHNIIPLFSRINDSYEESLRRSIEIMSSENDFIEQCAYELLSGAKTDKGYSSEILRSSHPAVIKRAVAILLKDRMKKPVESRHIELVFDSVMKGEDKVSITSGVYLVIKGDTLAFEGDEEGEPEWESFFEENVAYTPYGVFKLEKKEAAQENVFDYDKIKNQLCVGSKKEGDRFSFGRRRVTKSLKKLFNELKIPSCRRNSVAVIHDGENVVWVENVGVSRDYLPDENTKAFYLIKKEGKNDE